MEHPKQEQADHYVERPECENSWQGARLRQLGIDPDTDPIDILMQLSDWSARLEMCQWRRETLDKESIWHEARSTSLSR
jgi:hypothetical protein